MHTVSCVLDGFCAHGDSESLNYGELCHVGGATNHGVDGGGLGTLGGVHWDPFVGVSVEVGAFLLGSDVWSA